jgi:anthranilate phosphoribosyltransferase
MSSSSSVSAVALGTRVALHGNRAAFSKKGPGTQRDERHARIGTRVRENRA